MWNLLLRLQGPWERNGYPASKMINRKLRNFRCIFVYPDCAQALEAAGLRG
jgi:hypothetical protein